MKLIPDTSNKKVETEHEWLNHVISEEIKEKKLILEKGKKLKEKDIDNLYDFLISFFPKESLSQVILLFDAYDEFKFRETEELDISPLKFFFPSLLPY